MTKFLETILDSLKIITTIKIADFADILIIAFIIYKGIGIIKKTSSFKVARGVIVVLLALWLSGILGLNVVNFLLQRTVEVGLLALIVLFQPELRRILEKVGSSRLSRILGRDIQPLKVESAITQTVIACSDMAKSRTGALIIFERDNPLVDAINTGTLIDAEATSELIKNLFFPKAPLHDGAVIIRDGRVIAAGCMLPLSNNSTLSRDLGMRHRAGIGMSERSDAVVAIVSEETGGVSIAVDGLLKRHLAPDTFEKLLRKELIPDESRKSGRRFPKLSKVKANEEKNSSK